MNQKNVTRRNFSLEGLGLGCDDVFSTLLKVRLGYPVAFLVGLGFDELSSKRFGHPGVLKLM